MYELVSVSFPFANDARKGKPRPGFVVSPPIGKHNQVVVAYVTTRFDEVLKTDIILDPNESSFKQTGLVQKSLIKLNRLATFQPSALRVSEGRLPKQLIPELKKKLRIVFNLA